MLPWCCVALPVGVALVLCSTASRCGIGAVTVVLPVGVAQHKVYIGCWELGKRKSVAEVKVS